MQASRGAGGGRATAAEASDAGCFEAARPRLLAVETPLRPWFDARAFARTALLVADCLAQPATARKVEDLAKVGACDAGCIANLRESARALLHVLNEVAARRRPAVRAVGTADIEARALRTAMIDVVERALADSDEARLWLEVVRATRDDRDLVLDLRTLAYLYRLEEKVLEEVCDPRALELDARLRADALEDQLAGSPGPSEWDDWLTRAFALLVQAYEEACRVARFLARGDTQVDFASLVAIARARRRQPRVVTAPPPPMPEPPPHSVPAPAPAPASVAPPPPSSGRRHERHAVELEVDFASDSNFYVGFAENLSGGGIFVATYVLRPIGTKLDLTIQLAGDATPLRVRGEVRWTREPSRSGDLWPGMGVQFEKVAPEDEARIRAFLGARAPLFFDD